MSKSLRRGAGFTVAFAGLVAASCGVEGGNVPVSAGADASTSTTSAQTLVVSPAAVARIEELRARFVVKPAAHVEDDLSRAQRALPDAPQPAIRAGVGARFDTTSEGYVRALLPLEAKRGVAKTASVGLPVRASDAVRLVDDTSRLAVTFSLRGARDTGIATTSDGAALYAGALGGSDVVHRVHAEGTEDFVVFEQRPEHEEIAYDVNVSRVAGLRLVSNTLEFLDEGGTPRLRMAPPYVIDARGARHEAKLAVDGCAYDRSAAGPWGRAVTPSGAPSCGVRVSWASDVYPAIVDPAWTTTGSIAVARSSHTATAMASGRVLVVGGVGTSGIFLSSAEAYEPFTGTFGSAGAMLSPRARHTATALPQLPPCGACMNGRVLVTGGSTNSTLSSAEIYQEGDPVPFASTGALTTPRGNHAATRLNSGKVLVAGGGNSSAELFDGTSVFTATGQMTTSRQFFTMTLLNSGKVLIAGGTGTSSAELFDGTSSFAATGSMMAPREFHTATLLASGKVLIAGGQSGATTGLSTAELFDGVSTFSPTGSMTSPRYSHTATRLATGKVLITGGDSAPAVGPGPTTELFDGTSTFVASAPMSTQRVFHTATLLSASGKVLVVAGSSAVLGRQSTAELFALAADGGSCTVSVDCNSGVCEDGVCCSGPCSGICMTCTAGSGACVAVRNAADPDTCTGMMSCNASGTCVANTACTTDGNCSMSQYCDATGLCQPQRALGAACNLTADCKNTGTCRECTSGSCIDGVCCDSACGGQCHACDVTGSVGTCSPVTGAPHRARLQCTAGYACDATTDKCHTTCNVDADCASGFGCTNGTCVPRTGATCGADGHTTTDANNVQKDCAPFNCQPDGTCIITCHSVTDCAAPAVCDQTGACVASPSSGNSGGCSASRGSTNRDGWPVALLVAAVLGAFRRRRRAQRPSSRARARPTRICGGRCR